MIREFRLSPPGSGRGVSCDANGAFVGAILLLRRSNANGEDRWEPRDCASLSKQIGEQFGLPIDFSPRAGGLRAISNALNEGNVARAQIAAVLLGIPEPPMLSKGIPQRSDMIKFIRDLYWGGLIKSDWNPDEHPRRPAGAPDSQGGQFAPNGTGAVTQPQPSASDNLPAGSPSQSAGDLLVPIAAKGPSKKASGRMRPTTRLGHVRLRIAARQSATRDMSIQRDDKIFGLPERRANAAIDAARSGIRFQTFAGN